MAFPLVQGFFNTDANEMSPCAHCGMMTGSRKDRRMMEGTEEALHIQFTRFCEFSGNPLGRYRYGWCHDFNEWKGRLPNKEEVNERISCCLIQGKLKWNRENPESGYEFRCAQCGANDGPDNQLFREKSGRIVCYGLCALKANIERKKELFRNRTEDPEYLKRRTEEWKEWYRKKMENPKARSLHTERRRELYRKRMEDPEERRKYSEKRMKQHKKMMEDPDARKRYNKMRADMRKRNVKVEKPEARDIRNEKWRENYKKMMEDPEKKKIYNAKRKERMRRRKADPEKRKRDNERRRERRIKDQETKTMANQKQRETTRKKRDNPEARKRDNEIAAARKRKRRAELKENKRAKTEEEKA